MTLKVLYSPQISAPFKMLLEGMLLGYIFFFLSDYCVISSVYLGILKPGLDGLELSS